MTRQQYLQDLMDLKTKDYPEIGDWYIEYRPFDGWYTVPFGDFLVSFWVLTGNRAQKR